MCDGAHTFLRGTFHYFIAFTTEILHTLYLFMDWANTKIIIPLSVGA